MCLSKKVHCIAKKKSVYSTQTHSIVLKSLHTLKEFLNIGIYLENVTGLNAY